MNGFMEAYLLPWLHALVMAFIPVAGVAGMAWARKRGINADVLAAAARAAGEGYDKLRASRVPLSSPEARRIVAEAGRDYMLDMIPAKMDAVGLTASGAERIVGAEFGKLLAADPSVTLPR